MSDPILIRPGTPGDAAQISELIHSLAEYFLADPSDAVAGEPFFSTVSVEAIRGYFDSGRFRYHIAEVDGRFAGLIGVLEDRHIYHLFVAREYHRRGVAGRLWDEARAEAVANGNENQFTVNASLYAVPMYERFGFRAEGDEVHKDGVVFVFMRLGEAAGTE